VTRHERGYAEEEGGESRVYQNAFRDDGGGSKVKEDDLKILYRYAQGINEKLDKALVDCLEEFGYKRWACGMEVETKIRDLAFDKGK